MNIYLTLLLITFIICFITDISGIKETIKKLFWKWVWGKNKPYAYFDWEEVHPLLKILECSLCQVWWTTLIFIIVTGNFSLLTLAYCGVLSLFSSNITGLLIYLKEVLVKIENLLYRIIGE